MKAFPSRYLFCLLLIGCGLTASASAQTAFDPSRASESIRPDVTAQPLLRDQAAPAQGLADENNFALSTPGDSDIGQQLILKRQERVEPFYAAVDISEYYTDNAANVNSGAKDDFFMVSGATVGWQPRLSNRFYFDAWVAQHWFRYDKFQELDYEQGEAAVGFIAVMPELWNSIWHVHYYYERITQGIDETPIYQTHTLRAGAQKTVLIDRLNSINLSLLAALCLEAAPSELSRHEYSFYAAWNYKITRDLFVTASYRLGYYDYFNLEGREDWFNNFGVALTYHPKDWLEVALSWNYTVNRSNLDAFSYDSQLAGPSVSVKAKF